MRPPSAAARRAAFVCVVAAATLLTSGVGRTAPVTVTGTDGRSVTISDSSRVVSIGGSVTEILYALGRDQQIVAVDSTSMFPPRALKDKRNVGYMRALSPEGVLGLNPSLILALDGTGPKPTLAVLKAAGVPFVAVPDTFTGDGILAKIRLVAQAVGATERGACLARAVAADLDQVARMREAITAPRRVLFLLSFAGGRPMVAGRHTAADGIIRMAGAVNAVDAFDGYKMLTDEAVIAARPDVILVMDRDSHPLPAETVFAYPAFAMTPAATGKALISMGALYLLGFGPRTAQAARDLAHRLYPSLALPDLRADQAASAETCRP